MTTRPAASPALPWADDDAVTLALAGLALRDGVTIGAAGTVVEAGARAEALRGRDVLLTGAVPCGECEVCRRGGASVCPAAVALVPAAAGVRAHQRWCTTLDDSLSAPSLRGLGGALAAGPGALAYAMYARANVAPRDATIVVGDDVVARLLIDVLVAKGAPPIVVHAATGDGCARAHALDLPTAPAQDLAAALPAALVRAEAGARPRRVFVTDDEALPAGALPSLLSPLATMITASVAPRLDAATLAALAAAEATIRSVRTPHPDLVLEVAALAQRGELDLAGAAAMPALGAGWALRTFAPS
jgi:D-arabinose 1-dehydrogenase-like Zn-dependent alcohol dehydrogenase